MNLPNKLTVGRIILTVFFVAALSIGSLPHPASWALLFFVIAAITDYFDGAIARKHNLVTNFGKLMDPLADKVLIAAALILLVDKGYLWTWTVGVVIGREFMVTGLRLVAASDGIVVAAEKLGKWKTAIQMVCVIYFLTAMATEEPALAILAPAFQWTPVVGRFLEIAMLVLTLASGTSYLWKNRNLLSDS